MGLPILFYTVCSSTDGNVGTWYPCIVEQWFMGSPVLMALVIYGCFAVISYRVRLPAQIIIPTFMILSLVMAVSTNEKILWAIFMLSLIPVAGAIVIALLRRVAR